MSPTEKCPKWATLLLGLLLGGMIAFGGQLFIVKASPLIPLSGSSHQPTSCSLESPTSAAGTTTIDTSKLTSKEFTGLLDLLKDQKITKLKCTG